MSDITELLLSALERQSKFQAQQFDDLRASVSTLHQQLSALSRRVDGLDVPSRPRAADTRQPRR
ncbi:hypothetical protein QTI33_26265 [Variovorax sp. J22P271]|uniref:hypothetical protein n=1 Tax=Variovorax davisae TaxID=3053515 RepID=UPI00257602E9|nr:hypothetical protein [Variovorax sp. J22P271]MDM0035666.1 hypothetical protein [Variovorax sp. J22P271]